MRSGPHDFSMSQVFFCVAQNAHSSCKSGFYLTRLHLRTLGLLQPKPLENKGEDVSRNPSRWNKKMKWESNIRDQHLLQEQFSLNQV